MSDVAPNILVTKEGIECCTAALDLLKKYRPLKALWLALNENRSGPEVPVLIVRDPRCGIERRTTADDGYMPNHKFSFLEHGATPLMMATHVGREDVVEVLLDLGADVKASSGRGSSMHLAVISDSTPILKLLVGKGADVNELNKDGITPLYEAASRGHAEALLYLLSKGADPNLFPCGADSPLCLASMRNAKSVEALLDNGGGSQINSLPGRTAPLHEARKGPAAVLLSHGANVTVFDQRGDSPLHNAARIGHDALLKILLEAGASVDEQGARNYTPLHVAVAVPHNVDVINLLLDEGANISAKDGDGEIPLAKAHWYRSDQNDDGSIIARLTPQTLRSHCLE